MSGGRRKLVRLVGAALVAATVLPAAQTNRCRCASASSPPAAGGPGSPTRARSTTRAPTAARTPAGSRRTAASRSPATTTTPAAGCRHLKARLQVDDHDNPSILVRPDGRLMVFWSTHAGPTMWYRRTLHPEDITSWEPERAFPTNTPGSLGYTYPNPMQLSAEANRIYLFWRGGNFNPSMSTSRDGKTWSPARTVIFNAGQRPYVKYASNGGDTIAMAFTEGHPRNVRTSIYYAAYRAGALRRADGSVIAAHGGLPIAPTSGREGLRPGRPAARPGCTTLPSTRRTIR